MDARKIDRHSGRELGLDPVDVRLKNLIGPNDMPYVTPSGGGVYDGGNYPESLKKALNMIDYVNVRKIQKEARKSGRLIGIGMSTVLDSGTDNFAQIRIVILTIPFPATPKALE